MTSKHTPGPWITYTSPLDPERSAVRTEQGVNPICHLSGGERMDANARLIAAAPDLLQSVEWLLPIVEDALADWGNINAGGARQSIAKARAAIALARGEGVDK